MSFFRELIARKPVADSIDQTAMEQAEDEFEPATCFLAIRYP